MYDAQTDPHMPLDRTLSKAAYEYAEHAVLSDNPDYCGKLLYEAAVEACQAALAAEGEEAPAQWSHWVGRAQTIVAHFYDLSRTDSEDARFFQHYHWMIWNALNDALWQHRRDRLDEARSALEECLRQITARLQLQAATAPVNEAW